MNNINVIKRDGTKEPLNLDKFHLVVSVACEGLANVSASAIELKSQIQFYNNIKTSDIQETLIKAAADLISEETPNYQYVAGRLINYHIRKEIYGGKEIPSLPNHIIDCVSRDYYIKDLLDYYSPLEMINLNSHIKHERDYEFTYAAMEQWRAKYLVKNRVTNELYETPQFAYMCIAMLLFRNYKENRLQYVIDYYNAISTGVITLPTPVLAGLRTTEKQFSSCMLIECGDSIDSIIATAGSVVKLVSQKAGIGLGVGAIRGINSPIAGGKKYHTGVIPYLKLFQAGVGSCNQGGIRKGSATCHFPIWHIEVEDLIVLKNNKGTEETRVRHMDYSVQISKLFYQRYLEDGNITLFSPSDVPGLYNAFFSDQNEFERLYLKYEKDKKIRKKVVSALELFSSIMGERKDTGRIYIMNVDHCNIHSSFNEPIKMSNLCLTGDSSLVVEIEGQIQELSLNNVIQKLKNGKEIKVLSRNNKIGENQFKNIKWGDKTGIQQKLIKITDVETGKYVKCTPEHEIYTKNRGYVQAKELKETDILQTLK